MTNHSNTDSETSSDITDESIKALKVEAGQAGDAEMISTCNIALGWTDHAASARAEAREMCADIIAEAKGE